MRKYELSVTEHINHYNGQLETKNTSSHLRTSFEIFSDMALTKKVFQVSFVTSNTILFFKKMFECTFKNIFSNFYYE